MWPWAFRTLERTRVKRVVRGWTRALRRPGMPVVRPTILRILEHDAAAHTQGLAFVDSALYESTGLVGQSTLRRLHVETGMVAAIRAVPAVWAEGIAGRLDQLVQLTYTSGQALKYRLPDMIPDGSFRYEGEGWGLATIGAGYVMSNGSDVLTFRNAVFDPVRELPVRLCGKPLEGLNDLEVANGRVYANVFGHHDVYEISTETGEVERIIDCTEVLMRSGRREWANVLNGFAYSAERRTFFMTGKHWPTLFELVWQ